MELNNKISSLLFSTKIWFIARDIEQGDIDKQGLKLIEETGELVSGYLKNKEDVIKDSIGDVAVVVNCGYGILIVRLSATFTKIPNYENPELLEV